MESPSENRLLEPSNLFSISLTTSTVPQEAKIDSSAIPFEVSPENDHEDVIEHHLTGIKLYLVIAGLCISVLLVALVRLVAKI